MPEAQPSRLRIVPRPSRATSAAASSRGTSVKTAIGQKLNRRHIRWPAVPRRGSASALISRDGSPVWIS